MTPDVAYRRSAEFYDQLYAFKDFPATADRLREIIGSLHPEAKTVLDVGCGTGWHLQLLGADFERVGVDLSADMLRVAGARCPDVEFHEADMTELNLGRRFDVVSCLFSAVGYVRTPERLRRAIAAMAHHVAPGGLLLVEPWLFPNTYWEGHVAANLAEGENLKVTWMYVQERFGDISRFDIHYLVGKTGGVESFVERHEMGLFTDEQYREAFSSRGLTVEHDADGLFGRGLYLGRSND